MRARVYVEMSVHPLGKHENFLHMFNGGYTIAGPVHGSIFYELHTFCKRGVLIRKVKHVTILLELLFVHWLGHIIGVFVQLIWCVEKRFCFRQFFKHPFHYILFAFDF